MHQNKKQTLVEVNSILKTVIDDHMAGKPVLRQMAENIKARREQGIDRLITAHVPDEDSLADLADEIEFEAQ